MLKHKIFLEAIQDTNLLEVTFLSREKGTLTRTCAPMDFGPWRRHSSNNGIRYHFIDLDSTSGQHPLSLTADQILDIKRSKLHRSVLNEQTKQSAC